jgi:tetratricopeptide (TPR) repeat protein
VRSCLMIAVAAAAFAVVLQGLAQEEDGAQKAQRLCDEGEALVDARRIDDALGKFEEALDADLKCLRAHKWYQDILLARGERKQLLDLYRDFVKRLPNSALFNYLYSRLHADDLDVEQQYLKKAAELDGDFFDARLALGISFLAGKQYKEAIEQFEQCQRLKPKDAVTKFRMADVYMKLGDYDKARECYARVEKDMPDNPVIKYAVGNSYAYQGNHEEAIKNFAEADRLGFVDKDLYLDWAQSCFGLGRKADAVKVYEKIFKTDATPQDFADIEQVILSLCDPFSDLDPVQKTELAKAVALLEAEEPKPAEAQAALDKLAQDGPASEAVQQFLGRALLSQGKKDEARAAFEKAAKLNPDYPAPIVYLGILDLMARKYEAACDNFLKALALDPFNGEANTYAAALLHRFEDYKGAVKYARRAYLVTGSLRDVGDILLFSELYLEDEALYMDEFKAGPWKVTVYKGMEPVDPARAYALRFVARKGDKLDRVIVVMSRRVRDVDGPDPAAFATYYFLEETRRTQAGIKDERYEDFGRDLPALDKLIERVKGILEKDATQEAGDKKEGDK